MIKKDNELLQLLRTGEESAIKLIFDEYFEKLSLFAESLTKNHEVAEEIVEDLFIHLWQNAQKTDIQYSLKNYLFQSIHNNCLKYLNKAKAEQKAFQKFQYILEDQELLQSLTPDYPLSSLITEELENKANEILNSLPDQCREIYKLSRYENLNYPEIAKKLNINVGTVKTQMYRAFQKFREGLKDYLPVLLTLF